MRGTGIKGEGDSDDDGIHVRCISSTLQGRYVFDPPTSKRDTEETDV